MKAAATDQMFDDDILYFVPLGGSNEIGMNLNLYRYQGKWLMIDLGIGFADDWLPGVEVVVPDIDFIAHRREDIAGLVLTHAHEDHLGAVPYLWDQLRCPVYATPFTAAVLKAKLTENNGAKIPVQQIEPGSKFRVGPFALEYVPLTHSIPEMNAVVLRTEAGTVLHTGDWKFDPDPMVGPASKFEALEALGKEGVLALVGDSTNVFVEGESGSELTVRDELKTLVASCKNRVVVTTFASNVARLQSIVEAAREAGREVIVAGRAMRRMITAARDCGYLEGLGEVYSDDQAMKFPRHKVLIITTGCQGENRAGVWRMAAGAHPNIRLAKDDTVIFSSRDIPGNEKKIAIMINRFVQEGVQVITSHDAPIHVSGHPARDELSRMYQIVKPQIAVPVHGEQRHMNAHAKLATECGVPMNVVGYNGAVIRLEPRNPEVIGKVESGYMAVDGSSILPSDGSIMRMRRKIRDQGIVFVSMVVGNRNEVSDVRVTAPGLLDEHEDADWLDELAVALADAVEAKGKRADAKSREETVRNTVKRLFQKEFDKRPIVFTHLLAA